MPNPSSVLFGMRRLMGLLSLSCIPVLAGWGCGGDMLEYREVKRIDEKVSDAELAMFLKIVNDLPEKKLPDFQPPLAPPPDWEASRTLPVAELVEEEHNRLAERWSVGWLAQQWQAERTLQRVLRREEITPEQFAGLTLTLGIALSRSKLSDHSNLDHLIVKGDQIQSELKSDSRNFSTLTDEARAEVLRQAAWITRSDRVQRLQRVPPENLALVRAHGEKLESIFPDHLQVHPLDSITDVREEFGLPFEELPESGTDAQIEWDRREAVIGHDPPDPEFAAQRVPDVGDVIGRSFK